jgi:hypothetical protein
MAETGEAYKQRILGYVGDQDPLALLATMPSKLTTLLAGTSPNVLTRRPAPKKWSVTEIVAHLADTELVVGYRIRMILSAPGTPIQAVDQDVWATTGNYAECNAQRSLALFRLLREWNLGLLTTLDAAQWQQYGVHTERGVETVADIAAIYAGHDLSHLRQITAILDRGPRDATARATYRRFQGDT